MRHILLAVVLAASGFATWTASAGDDPLPPITISEVSTDETYGRVEANPIKVGGGPSRERDYLNLLRGPNGEPVRYNRNGSCCGFETKNSPFGGGLLDIYSVWIGDATEPQKLYLNMYDYEQPKAPKGFTFAAPLKRL